LHGGVESQSARRGKPAHGAVESPGILRLLQAIESHGEDLDFQLPRHSMCLDALDYARTGLVAAVVIENFQNPLGSCMPGREEKALVEMLAHKETP
jgi:DNA-binding transcriptional MocR family regulator